MGLFGFFKKQLLKVVEWEDDSKDTIVYDIVYNPVKTILIKEAQRRGLRTIGGLDMLIYQAQRAIEIWTGRTPDVNLMKIAAMEALQC